MKALVTGGAGFVGKHLVDALCASGREVVVINNLSFGRKSHVPTSVKLIELDLGLCGTDKIAEVLREHRPDEVYHLAAIHFIPYCMDNPDVAMRSNTMATSSLVGALQKYPVQSLVFTSTMDVYEAADRIHSEADLPQPANIYGMSKALSEQIVEYAVRVGATGSATVFRMANVYGPNETNSHVIPDAIKKIMNRGAGTIQMGYLGAERDFVFVKDVAQALLAAGDKRLPGLEVYNLGTGIARAVRQIIAELQILLSDTRAIEEDQRQFRKFDRATLTPDVTAITAKLGWTPHVSIEQGLAETVAYEADSTGLAQS